MIRKILRYFFELRFIPGLSLFLFNNETWLRLRPLKRFFRYIDPDKTKKIIDIGGGSGRLELQLKRKDIYIYDVNEESIQIAKRNFPNTILGTGHELKLEDNSFDWAISVHTLEHVPGDKRERFILDMVRISKEGIYLNFPAGEYAEKICVNFLDRLEKNGKEPNKWTVEHLEKGLPRIEQILKILSKQNKFSFRYLCIRNFSSENHYWTNIRASDNLIESYFLSPVSSIIKYFNYKKLPGIEVIFVGSKTNLLANEIINKL